MMEKSITESLNKALKNKELIRVSVLRMLICEIKNKKIADRVKELDDEKILKIVQKMARQHNESIEQFKRGNREDLVEKEMKELEILKKYLPEPVSEEEINRIVSDVISRTGAASLKDLGKVMGECLSLLKGRADGRIVGEIVRKKLS
ncbi:MAG: GatB/YqeY domain-containing protein [Candidatus Omnitrophota bacterium]